MIKDLNELRLYTGWEITKRINNSDKREAYICNWEQMKINYEENIDFQLRREQVMLCDETVDFLYSKYTSKKTKYIKGTRPLLEKITSKLISECINEKDKFLELMKFCRDLYKKFDREQLFYGGTEEELIKKGEQLCECLGRLMVSLCEIEGMPGRIVMHVIGGHIVSEILVDGKWVYVDPRCGLYCSNEDGSLASIWEIWQDPQILKNQDDEVKSYISPVWTYEERLVMNITKFFNEEEIIVFNNYSLMDADEYNYDWISVKEAIKNGLFIVNERYNVLCDKVFGFQGE